MQIQKITANNFKSLIDFEMQLPKFICLTGLNGSGKSTVLQFIDFLGQQVRGDIKGWLKERNWTAKEIKSQFTKKSIIDFSVELYSDKGEGWTWTASFNSQSLHCTTESIETPTAHLRVHGNRFSISMRGDETPAEDTECTLKNGPVSFKYEGSILSQLKESTLPPSLIAFKEFFQNVTSLDLLSPEYLRRRTREADGSIGLGGQKLSAFLHELGTRKQRQLVKQLQKVYPQLEDLHTKSLQSGWKQLEITEKYQGQPAGFFPLMTTEARHVNDGMLRLIAILAELQSSHRFLLFDEIENGINPELVEFVLDALVSSPQQIMVTTHSPMILNYLDDEVAREGVLYLYRNHQGHTKAIPFFSIPSLSEKLTVMGPGEAFADTDLKALYEEIESVIQGQ